MTDNVVLFEYHKNSSIYYYVPQEKTDEVTNKFLDKRKDISTYQAQSQPLAAVDINEDLQEVKREQHKSLKKRVSSPPKRQSRREDLYLTEDEMSVNTINK